MVKTNKKIKELSRMTQAGVVLCFSCAVCVIFTVGLADEGVLRTIGLLVSILVFGTYLISKNAKEIKDKNLYYLIYFFAFKLLAGFVLLKYGWSPSLLEATSTTGVDAARYYWGAKELVESGFNFSLLSFGTSYTGILFYLGIIFKVFGHNPVAPFLINSLTTLLAALLVLNTGYRIQEGRRSAWVLGLILVIPEVIWFDVLSSKETLTMSLLCFTMLPFLFLFSKKVPFRAADMFFFVPSFILLCFIRPPYAVMVVGIIGCAAVFARENYVKYLIGTGLVIFFSAAIFLLPYLTKYTGGHKFNLGTYAAHHFIKSPLNTRWFEKHDEGWTQNSIGRILIPESYGELLLMAPAKIAVNLIAPLPTPHIRIDDLMAGMYYSWQRLFQALSSVLYILLFPLVLGITFDSTKNLKKELYPFVVTFWLTICTVSLAALMIHPRYRICMIPFFAGCAWFGWYSNKCVTAVSFLSWGSFLITGGIIGFLYKLGIV